MSNIRDSKISYRFIISYILKAITIICAATGVLRSMGAGSKTFMGGNTTLLYFTIQSNIWIILVCIIGFIKMITNGSFNRLWSVIKLVFTVSITLTGIVFCFVLAPTMGKYAWSATNVLTHVIVPITAVLDLLIIGKYGSFTKNDVYWVTLPPIYYLCFASIGYVQHWNFGGGNNYPYFFLNWGSPAGAFGFCKGLPFMGVLWWVLLILVFLILCAKLYLAIINLSKRH